MSNLTYPERKKLKRLESISDYYAQRAKHFEANNDKPAHMDRACKEAVDWAIDKILEALGEYGSTEEEDNF
jgi:hypothetical protein